MEVLGLVKVRNADKIEECLKELRKYCDKIAIVGNHKLSNYGEINQIPVELINPDWIISLYSDEILSSRFSYMARMLMGNDFINTWDGHILHFWDEKNFRVDKSWDLFDVPFLWRFMPEIDYKWGEEIVPLNQPGPEKHSSCFLFNHRFNDKTKRAEEFKQFLKDEQEYNMVTRQHYHSLINTDGIILERWGNE
jgi:hypothetical protein